MSKNSVDLILSEILAEVEEKGESSVDWLILLNDTFRSDKGDSRERMEKWAKENGLRVSMRDEKRGSKKLQYVDFTKM